MSKIYENEEFDALEYMIELKCKSSGSYNYILKINAYRIFRKIIDDNLLL